VQTGLVVPAVLVSDPGNLPIGLSISPQPDVTITFLSGQQSLELGSASSA
jgi:hypothetical protein